MISIREFEIEARINYELTKQAAEKIEPDQLEVLKKEIIAESVERVLTIIKNQKER